MSEDKKALLNFSDLSGLSQPLEKLTEVIGNGIGASFKLLFSKKITDSTVYEVNALKSALEDTDSEVTIVRGGTTIKLATQIEKAALDYTLNKEGKKLGNTFKILEGTASILKDKESVSEKPIDEDWSTRFFNIIGDVNTEMMQNLWSQILADEIEKPNSYSIRTLETLKNISSAEARLFVSFTKICFLVYGSVTPSTINDTTFLSKFNISLQDMQLLKELNLVDDTLSYTLSQNAQFPIMNCNKVIFINNNGSNEILLPIYTLTTIGKEINNLIDNSFELSFAQKISEYFKTKGDISTFIADIVSADGDKIEYVTQSVVPL